jgi:hypothetical protein
VAGDGKYDMKQAILGYGTVDMLKWVVVEPAPLTGTGLNEIVGASMTKAGAEAAAKDIYRTKKWRRRAQVMRRDELVMATLEPKKKAQAKKEKK